MARMRTFKQIIDDLTVAGSLEEVHEVGAEISYSYQNDKFSFADEERLMALYTFALNAYGEKCCFKRSDMKSNPSENWICSFEKTN